VRRNANGELSIQDENLHFRGKGKPVAQLSIASIHKSPLADKMKFGPQQLFKEWNIAPLPNAHCNRHA
jgi:hypothetical protein